MRTRFARSRFAAVLLAGTLVSSQAFAQAKPPPPTPADVQEAAKQSELGNRLFNEGVYESALPHFQRAYALTHKPADLQKVAESFKALGQTGPAYEAYAKLLADHAAALGYVGTMAAKKAMASLDGTTGTLDIHAPDGAIVRVGDRTVGTTPLAAPPRVALGLARVEIVKDGFEPFLTRVTVEAGTPARVDATLVARVLTGHLAVREAHGGDAHLLVDGADVGALPWEGDLAPGVHQLTLQSPTLHADALSVKVVRGTKSETVIQGDFTASHLQVTAHPDVADIALDGKSLGKGKFDGDVALGDHLLRVTADGYAPAETKVTVNAQATATEEVTLKRVITDAELAEERARQNADAIKGLYGQFAIFGAVPVVYTDLSCSETAAPGAGLTNTCTPGFVFGGGATLRGGYSFGAIGLELVGGFMMNRWEDDLAYAAQMTSGTPANPTAVGQVAHKEAYTITAIGGMVAAGPRLMTTGRTFRLTLGVAGGAVYRQFQLERSLNDGLSESPSYSQTASVINPAATGDLGFIIGSTPGFNFVIGAMAWMEFAQSTQISATTSSFSQNGSSSFNATSGPYTVESGPQVYIGPYLGLRFGH